MSSTKATMKTTGEQPQAVQMSIMSVTKDNGKHIHKGCEHDCESGNASRVRGGGAGKNCFLGCIACFLCCECCESICGCIADIICCPCELCC